jgi:hypothetical protein
MKEPSFGAVSIRPHSPHMGNILGSAFGAVNPCRRSTYPIHFEASQMPTITIAKATGPRQPHLNKR